MAAEETPKVGTFIPVGKGKIIGPPIIRKKLKVNVLYLATLLTTIELVLSIMLFVLILRILDLASEIDSVQAGVGTADALTVGHNLELLLTAAGIAALFSAWMIVIGGIVGGLISVMAQVAEEKPDPSQPWAPIETVERIATHQMGVRESANFTD
jgi:uncharacterized membrane protein